MKKTYGTRICNILSAILLLGFIIKTVVDYSKYLTTLNSAPFYIWIIANALYFIIPAIVVFIVGVVIKHKSKKGQ